MSVGYTPAKTVHSVPGVRITTAEAGIRYRNRDDLVLLSLDPGACVSAVFTRNRFCAAPVVVARDHLGRAGAGGEGIRALLINAGNANAGTGAEGERAARACCRALAVRMGVEPEQVLPFSTGVIGELLPVERIEATLDGLVAGSDPELSGGELWVAAARGIATTDTVHKVATRQVPTAAGLLTISGIAKGSGMIHPNMATMLAFIATDACLPQDALDSLFRAAVDQSFNAISVDGDTSTNDAAVLVARARDGVLVDQAEDRAAFVAALDSLCLELAEAIVRDGEGATKFVRIEVKGAKDDGDARAIAESVALSPLVKTALFASDPNWGRILAAVGRAPVSTMDLDAITIDVNDVRIVENGGRAASYCEAAGQRAFAEAEIRIVVDLHLPEATGQARRMTCDFSYDYVRINAEYRS